MAAHTHVTTVTPACTAVIKSSFQVSAPSQSRTLTTNTSLCGLGGRRDSKEPVSARGVFTVCSHIDFNEEQTQFRPLVYLSTSHSPPAKKETINLIDSSGGNQLRKNRNSRCKTRTVTALSSDCISISVHGRSNKPHLKQPRTGLMLTLSLWEMWPYEPSPQ